MNHIDVCCSWETVSFISMIDPKATLFGKLKKARMYPLITSHLSSGVCF